MYIKGAFLSPALWCVCLHTSPSHFQHFLSFFMVCFRSTFISLI